MNIFRLLFWVLLLTAPAQAADNTVVVTTGSGVTLRSKDVGTGVQAMIHILGDAATGAPIYGTAGTANSNVITIQGIASGTAVPVSGTFSAPSVGATGSAVPASADYVGFNSAGNLVGISSSNPLPVVGTGIVTSGAATASVTFGLDGAAATTTPVTSGTYTNGNSYPLTQSLYGGLRIQHMAPVSATMQSSASSAIVGTAMDVTGFTSAMIAVQCSVACSGTVITFQVQSDININAWSSLLCYPVGSNTPVTTATTSGDFQCPVAGATSVRTNITTYSMGTITTKGFATTATFTPPPLPVNAPFNIAQINGVTPLMGNGATGTGSPRVTIANDNSIPTGWPTAANQTAWNAATGAAPPANVAYLGANASGATGGHMAGLIACDKHVTTHITSATDTLAVQGVASQSVYICGYNARAAGVATWFLEIENDTNANCGSVTTQLTGLASEVANSGMVVNAPFWNGLKTTSGTGLCIKSTGTGGVDVDVFYTQL